MAKTNYGVNVGGIIAGIGSTAVIVWVAAVIGWIANLVQVIKTPGPLTEAATWSMVLIVKTIGILAVPVGSVMGWVGFFS